MQAYQENISAKVSGVLSPVLGVEVTVTDTATGNPAALYSDNGVTPISQPLVTDETGYFGFYAANGDFKLTFASAQVRVEPRFVQLYDPDDDAPLTQQQAAASSGASKIGLGQGTVENALNALQLVDFAALRAYPGDRIAAYVAKAGIAGTFVRDAADSTTADDNALTIVDALGRRWKRLYSGPMNVLWFGADPSYATDATAAFQAAILAGSWNGTTIYVPNGTYRIEGTIYIGVYAGTQNCYSVSLIGESTHGSVLMRPKSTGTGPIINLCGFHNIVEKLTMISDVNLAGTDYSASHGLYIRGNPQTGTNGNGTKECAIRNLKIYRVGTGLQIGDYDVDGKDPDIETNKFEGIEISNCNTGIYINGQNILHNPFYNCHVVDCRDYLMHQKRGGDAWFERCYFGGMYDYLTNNYNVASTVKIYIEAGVVALRGCRSEDWASTAGNATSRYVLYVNSGDSKTILIDGCTFTARDNLTTEPCVKFKANGSAGSVSNSVVSINNAYRGYVELDSTDFFDIGSSFQGTGAGVVNGRLLSANQKAQNFRDLFFGMNQTMELPGAKFKRNSAVPITIERSAVGNSSEWLGPQFYDENGLYWGRLGMRVANATSGSETSLVVFGSRHNGALNQIGITYAAAAPTKGVWAAGDEVRNTAPAVGSPKSWLNTAAGGASSTTRADATVVSVGTWAKWSTGTTVWECTTGGTTTTGAPSITGITVGQTVTDGTVVWTLRSTTQANFVSTGNL